MNKKKRLKKKETEKQSKRNNILFWLAIIGTIGSILVWLYNYRIDNLKEKHSSEITQLNTKISSIERNIGENDYFDVKQLFVSKNNKLLPNSSYLASGNFYADTTSSKWNYKQISPVNFIRKELEINPIELQLGREYSFTLDSIFKNPEFKNYKRKYKFHQFKYKDSLKIEVEGKQEIFNSSINVIVVKKDVAKNIFEIVNKNINKEKTLLKQLDIDSTIVNQVIKTAKKQFNQNSSSLIFNLILNGMVYGSLTNGNILELESIQKKSEVFYTKYTREYENKPNKIFETGEIFFADKDNHIYIVLIKVFDKQPIIKTELAADINKWLFSLKFL
ncbi:MULTISPECIES: hypothetical protein [unclassified Polaribacter]|uniref:hypothetical protein n=1 Tax=unclassified Polaribacter TaxID=196858 RepID=UPI0011BE4593|nr:MULTISPECIES: hypothetical protein [unclassified Polaribacter]TXD54057.1 hypothetical protein ES043_02030 [Polaribacter sp. IC063]TXD62573.1 hypothetical protein ES044_01060 [Polaribacter sp. IC066]